MTFSSTTYKLREACQNDNQFLYALHKATLGEYVDRTWGWDESWQQEYFFDHFNEQQLRIIQIDNTDIGVLSVEENDETMLLRIIEILPRYQNRGIGTSIIKDIIKNALSKSKTLRVQVLTVNERARTLYEKLGFSITGETDTHYLMEYIENPG